MKNHAIIPIFIPHLGCPHKCVFCDQKAITSAAAPVSEEEVIRTAETYLSTLQGSGAAIEMSFFGGSFTGIPLQQQKSYLAIARRYKEEGRISSIHLSTRPDYIDRRILDNLKEYGTDVIELGVQSFDPQVLRLSERGHSPQQVWEACRLIKEYGFTLGIQLMTGLPGDSYQACMRSAQCTVDIAPAIARIYPTVILKGTPLAKMYLEGSYQPFSPQETLRTATAMYKLLTEAGIRVIRVGLKASDRINDGEASDVLGGTFHPAFRQLVEGELAKEKIEEALKGCRSLVVRAGTKALGAVIGHKACNKKYFAEQYPQKSLRFICDSSLEDHAILFEKNL